MAEENQSSETEKEEKKAKKSPKEKAKQTKSEWTLKKIMRIAKRFDNQEEWSKRQPSSYKAAQSHNWVTECTAHMSNKVTSINKDKAKKKPRKKAPLPQSA